jgi:hypothetical protein
MQLLKEKIKTITRKNKITGCKYSDCRKRSGVSSSEHRKHSGTWQAIF